MLSLPSPCTTGEQAWTRSQLLMESSGFQATLLTASCRSSPKSLSEYSVRRSSLKVVNPSLFLHCYDMFGTYLIDNMSSTGVSCVHTASIDSADPLRRIVKYSAHKVCSQMSSAIYREAHPLSFYLKHKSSTILMILLILQVRISITQLLSM